LAPPAAINSLSADFVRLLEYYGLTLGIYTVDLKVVEGNRDSVVAVGHPEYSINAQEWTKLKLTPASNHSRTIKAFEVTFGPYSDAKIGWEAVDVAKYGRVLFDCTRCLISAPKSDAISVEGISVDEGTVVRFEREENKIFVDGTLVASSEAEPAANVSLFERFPSEQRYASQVEVVLSLKGECRISAIELSY